MKANVKDCIQVLGGIGCTWEHDAHLYLRRAHAIGRFLGGAETWLRRITALTQAGVRRRLGIDLTEVEDQRQEIRQAALAEAGLQAPHWPAPYGRGAGPAEQLLIDQELAAAGVVRPDLVIGWWAAPTILEHGTPEQVERFVPGTTRGEFLWSSSTARRNRSSVSCRAQLAANSFGVSCFPSRGPALTWPRCAPKRSGPTAVGT